MSSYKVSKVTYEYNGYPNYETWNIELWIDNEEWLYNERIRFLKYNSTIGAAEVELFCRGMFPDGTPDMCGASDMEKVDWEHLAELWREEAEDL